MSKGEYWCPLCRQLANTALPIVPEEGAAVVRPVPKTDRDLVLNIADTMAARQITRVWNSCYILLLQNYVLF